ncbi:two-component regulator propeller domain-containing protein [Carboxylicivirga sp. M1479]|uniref:type IX secretion system anionic LPS delivery protein PorZ n=1 Tax=Carboxylicivirga sp. M1479 TaxID=2594476 RepID=UPI001178A7A1|nr:two-component regulator propeller domain-containing protein [Carboxylicivirga sp. M1479]TRX71219.1 T9SS type A sorting domain-containing protein [Carboxylicivirga sp. M1479]
MHRNILFITTILFIALGPLKAQDTKWRDHFSYRNTEHIAESENYTITASEMGLMILNKLTKEINTYSRVNGLSDVSITAVNAFSNDRFIIGYANGNVDILSENNIINIPDFKLKQIQGTKQINHFHIVDNTVYCSTDYALLVINIEKYEVSDTYFLGYNAESLKIYQTTVIDNHIYAATERGLLKADLTDPLIVYDKAWIRISTSSNPHVAVNKHENEIVSTVKNYNSYVVFYGDESNWQNLKTTSNFKSLKVFGGQMVISYQSAIEIYNEVFTIIKRIENYSFDDNINAQDATYSSYEDVYFIADYNHGLVLLGKDADVNYIANGPYSNNCFDIHATRTGVYSTGGGINSIYNNLNRTIEYSYFDFEQWNNYRSETPASSTTSRDLLRICSNAINDSVAYMCTWGGGIYETKGIDHIVHFDETNSGLQDIYPDARKYVRVGGIASDSKGNIWMSNSSVNQGIVVKNNDQWLQFDYEAGNFLHSTGQFLMTHNDVLWIPVPMSFTAERQGIMVVDTKGSLDQSEHEYKSGMKPTGNDQRNKGQLQLWDENRNVITKLVLSMAEDKNGYIWLGTDKGVLVYYRPWAIFSEDYPIASRIKVPRNDGSNLADYLLEKENVSCIAVDGANRKWLGTENSGIYLVSEDGLKTYASFNMDNSPLPSNTITSVAVSPTTGEVFIGTAKGIVSYKGYATEGGDDYNDLYAYPNPVREDYNGDITITGLVQNSILKITNVSGKLVHETTSLGGKAYWDGKNLSGENVKTGVYLIYVSSPDGEKSSVTKLLIVR